MTTSKDREAFLRACHRHTDTTVPGCWVWGGRLDRWGYGRLGFEIAHRLAYETHVGPIPAGLVIDHLCRNRACVNPAHMEPVTHAENTRRGDSPSAQNGRRTHCTHGHEFTPENTRVYGRKRACRKCDVRKSAAYKARKMQSAAS